MNFECPLIEIGGAPYERGTQYGEAAKERIARGLAHYTEQLGKSGFTRERIHAVAREYLPVMRDFEPDYVREMEGIAAGAGIKIEDVAFLNARTEIVKLGQNKHLLDQLGLELKSDECTSALALPEATGTGNVIHGQNWDWKVDCAEASVVLRIKRDDGPDVLTFTEAGGLARSGMNAGGIVVTSNYLDCERDYRSIGVPLLLARRKMLEASHLALINRIVYASRRSGSNNLMISHVGGVAYDLECAPDEIFVCLPENGILTHANHWESLAAQTKVREMGMANTPDSLVRGIRIKQLLLADRGKLTRASFKAVFLDDYQFPYSICRPPRESVTMPASATIASIVMEAAEGIMELALLPALNPHYTTFRLTMEDPEENRRRYKRVA
ncbi:MAG: C45 family autoproteolytic acyltransferase/hydrolase [Variibacter sp.]